MLSRAACIFAATALLLAACDDSTSTTDSPPEASDTPNGTSTQLPGELVGSWVAPAGDFAVAHMVLRADGTGATLGISGTRRDVRSIRWSTQDSTLELADSTGIGSSKVFHARGDTLRLLTYYPAGRIDTIVFVRESEPSLVPHPGERATALVGIWHGSARQIGYTLNNSGDLVPDDTSWIPDGFRFQGDGTGMHLEYENEYVCDTLPLGTPFTDDGSWDSLTTPDRCDPETDGLCSYSAVEHCYNAYLPTDTTRFTWWTSRSDLYLGVWVPGSASQAIVGTQVMGWSVAGDSLKIQAYHDRGLVQGYKRAP